MKADGFERFRSELGLSAITPWQAMRSAKCSLAGNNIHLFALERFSVYTSACGPLNPSANLHHTTLGTDSPKPLHTPSDLPPLQTLPSRRIPSGCRLPVMYTRRRGAFLKGSDVGFWGTRSMS
jgi:hypothetical protein